MNFQNVAIKCDTWEQMEHLARIAEEQGYVASKWFTEEWFDDGDVFFEITNGNEYNCFTLSTYPVLTYTQFINQSDTPSVYGC